MSQRAARRSSRSGSDGRRRRDLRTWGRIDSRNLPLVTWRYLSYHKEMGRPCSSGVRQRSHQPESGGEESPRPEQLNKATELRFYRLGMIPVLSS
jgi:hypothetical protein